MQYIVNTNADISLRAVLGISSGFCLDGSSGCLAYLLSSSRYVSKSYYALSSTIKQFCSAEGIVSNGMVSQAPNCFRVNSIFAFNIP